LCGRFASGLDTVCDATFHVIEPERRIADAYDRLLVGAYQSVSLATLEPRGDGLSVPGSRGLTPTAAAGPPAAARRFLPARASGTERVAASLVVYYDGSCPLCTVEIDHYAAQRGGERLAFVDVSAPGADAGADLSPAVAMQRFHVRLPDGRLLSGARAFVAIWSELPGWRLAARIARVPGVAAALELGYRLFLPLRPLLSRLAGRLGARATRDGAGVHAGPARTGIDRASGDAGEAPR
jgi:predicted DCC family thiol-disulfide oxidoreductase YuxK